MEYVKEVFSNLKPDTTYTFIITVKNGVSDQDMGRDYLRKCKLTATTMEGSKTLIYLSVIAISLTIVSYMYMESRFS